MFTLDLRRAVLQTQLVMTFAQLGFQKKQHRFWRGLEWGSEHVFYVSSF